MNATLDGDRLIDPLRDLEDYEEYDARLGEMNGLGRPKDTSRYTRKTLMAHNEARPVINREGEDIREPTLDEGVSFVQKMAKDPPYV